ncbi:hypothetical protein OUZ56_013949 [Daphnia magna]|uniref:Uncharacterized protein n=1 Tax=Daphnia magna TaxID=35525 RepID=A0ABQ9Z7F3_9CRUS|nr:hypothetical protein OUZ56_013949 [Daphnia magna]
MKKVVEQLKRDLVMQYVRRFSVTFHSGRVSHTNATSETEIGTAVLIQLIYFKKIKIKEEHCHHPPYTADRNGWPGKKQTSMTSLNVEASQKLNLASPQRRKRHGSSDGAESPIPAAVHRFGTDFSGLLRRNPPPPPPHLLRRLGLRENPGVGKYSSSSQDLMEPAVHKKSGELAYICK